MSGLRQRERRLIAKLRIYFETLALGYKDNFCSEQEFITTLLNLFIYAVRSLRFGGFRKRVTRT